MTAMSRLNVALSEASNLLLSLENEFTVLRNELAVTRSQRDAARDQFTKIVEALDKRESSRYRWTLCKAEPDDDGDRIWRASCTCEIVAHHKIGNYVTQPVLEHWNGTRRLQADVDFYWRPWTLNGIPGFEET